MSLVGARNTIEIFCQHFSCDAIDSFVCFSLSCIHYNHQLSQIFRLTGLNRGGDLSKTVLGSETAVLRQDWSQTGLGFGLAALVLVLVLVLYFWSCLKHCCARQALCDMIMLKCNKHLYFLCNKCRNSAKCNWSSYHFLTFFAQLFFDNKHACCNRRAFCYVVLLLLNWSWS